MLGGVNMKIQVEYQIWLTVSGICQHMENNGWMCSYIDIPLKTLVY